MHTFRDWLARHKTLLMVNAALVGVAVAAVAVYAAFGHAVVEAAYHGRSFGFLNAIISGQAQYSVEFYFGLADRAFAQIVFFGVVVSVLVQALAMYLRGLGRSLTAVQRPPRHPAGDLFLVSFLVLFAELAAIRWFPAYVVFLTFFTNFVLIAAFVGMSIGCLAARRPVHLIQLVPLFGLLAIVAAGTVYWMVTRAQVFAFRVGSLADPEHVFFGTSSPAAESAAGWVVPIEAVIGLFFVLIALVFIGLGQELGRALARIDHRLKAYAINIGGSLAGIVAFTAMSYLSLSAAWWFGVVLAGFVPILRTEARRRTAGVGLLLVGPLVIAGLEWVLERTQTTTYWSPYYHIRYEDDDRRITVNTIGHQVMIDRNRSGLAYSLPYLLRRDSGGGPLRRVLIIGAGSGNDAACALHYGATHIDAVEIDPVIAALGRRDHPNRPYDDPRVNLVIADGRHFMETASESYDLIVYALVDSLTLHSCYSSVRLESFLFTREAFEAVRTRLKKDGLFVAYNFFRQGWVATRVRDMLAAVFDQEPLVIALPSRRLLTDTACDRGMTVLLAGDIAGIRQRFQTAGAYVLDTDQLGANRSRDGFAAAADRAAPTLGRVFPAQVKTARPYRMPTDDWPFLYLKDPRVPWHNLAGLAMVLLLSLALLVAFAPGRSLRVNPHFFFLGAGFMLIETHSVIRFALLFGSTWLVNSIVFFAILVMILGANLYVLWRRPHRLRWYYVALLAFLGANVAVELKDLWALPAMVRPVAACALVFLPIFFAGVVFATSFGRSRDPDLDFGANIAGVVVGGLLEYAALVIGYRLVLLIGMGLYALSLFGRRRLYPAA